MAIYYCKVKNISRGSGSSAVGSAAYRANEKIKNEFDGKIHNYTNKHDVVHKEIIAPDKAPYWVNNRKKLWNEVEKMEKASNSRLAREITVALPNELGREQQIELAREYCKEAFMNQGMVADLCIHDKGDGNPHAHIMVTTRGFDEHGKWLPKSRKEYIRDEYGEKIKLPSGEWKSRKIDINDWNTKERLQSIREQWAEVANRYLPKELHIDHRSYEEQGKEKIGMVHMGHGATALERKGIETEKGNLNREIEESNRYIELLNQEAEKTNREAEEINKELNQMKEQPEQSREEELADREIEESHKELQNKEQMDLNREVEEIEKLSMQERFAAAQEEAARRAAEKIRSEEIEPPREKENIAAEQQRQIQEPEISEKRSDVDTAKEMLDLQSKHLKLDMELSERIGLEGIAKNNIRQIENATEEIFKSTERTRTFEREIEKLQQKNQSLNLFQGKEKRAINEEIKHFESFKNQVANNLERDYGIKPEQAQAKLEELPMQRSEIISKMPSQAEIELLKDRQEMVAIKYRTAILKLELRPDREQIKELMQKMQPTRIMDSKEQLKVAQAERKLKTFGKSELEKLLKFVPEKSDVSELIKDKIESITVKKLKNIHREIER